MTAPTSTVAVDCSEFQPPVNDTYPHRWITFRVCDGSYVDHNAAVNLAWCKRALAAGRLDGYGVYVVYRPGLNAKILGILDWLSVPADCTVMVDAETWGGQISGDQSPGFERPRDRPRYPARVGVPCVGLRQPFGPRVHVVWPAVVARCRRRILRRQSSD